MNSIKRASLSASEYAEFYQGYLSLVSEDITLRTALDDSGALLSEYLHDLPDGREHHAYAPGKWTVKEALQHVIDTERVFAYRALWLGRQCAEPLPGFEQNDFAASVDVSLREFDRMIAEFEAVRKTTISLFNGFADNDLVFVGTVSGGPMSCRAMGFILAGHTYHHVNIYRERY